MTYDPAWDDPNSAWWAKANRAKEHLDSLHRQVASFRASGPYSLTPEPTDVPDRLAYRLKIHRPFPVTFSTLIGDVLHNLRAALECLAFEVARRSRDRPMTAAQEGVSTFPICKTPEAFDRFFRMKDRNGLYDDRAREAFRLVQPFWLLESARQDGIALERTFEEEFKWATLPRLHALWNMDKHRRLTLMAWWPDIIYWGSNGPSNRRALPGDGTVTDGSILLYIEGNDEGQSNQISHEFNIVLTDDPAYDRSKGETSDVVDLLERWHQHIVSDVFMKVFTIMSKPRP